MLQAQNNDDSLEIENFVQQAKKAMCKMDDEMMNSGNCTKHSGKRIRRLKDPRIEPYRTGGKLYYRYRRGIDQPIHLGNADYILRKVKG